jgi:hypothetical protein
MMAALLDENGVFLRMEEVLEPTNRHLPQITQCDLPSGKYQWVADANNPFGGAFWPVAWLQRVEQDKLDVIAAAQAAQVLAQRRAQRKVQREAEEAERRTGRSS